jgi:hypothetical protein
VADHGESLFDDGFLGHGHMINRQQTHIPLILSQPGLKVPQPVGLDDLRGLILGALAGEEAPIGTVPAPVFQYIGSLETPSSIGLVEAAGRTVVFDLQREVVDFGGEVGTRLYAELDEDQPLKERTDRLIREWERQRWISHLAHAQRS